MSSWFGESGQRVFEREIPGKSSLVDASVAVEGQESVQCLGHAREERIVTRLTDVRI